MVSEVLERYRIENGISQKELAARLDTTQAAVSSWERGIRTPTPAFRKRIKDLTGCDTAELMTKTARQKPAREARPMETITSPLRAIRANCLQCANSAHEVKLCPVEDCPLYPFRFGKNPFHKRTYTDEQRRAVAERLTAARAAKDRESGETEDEEDTKHGDGH